MPWQLNNVTTADNYTDGNTLECPGTQRARVTVANAAVYVKQTTVTGAAAKGEPFLPEIYFAPGIYPIPGPTTRIAVRSAVASTPAQVTIDAY